MTRGVLPVGHAERTGLARDSTGVRLLRRLEVVPFLLPGLLLFGVFVLWPMLQGLRVSFYNWSIMPGADQQWVGLANYLHAFKDPIVRIALRNTLLYTIVTVPGQMALGLAAAALMNAALPARTLWRGLYYLPVVTSWVVIAYLWRYLFSGGPAPVNYLLHDIFHVIPKYIDWFSEGSTAQVPILTLGIWKGIGWNMVMFLAGLQGIPAQLYEAAAIDGAGRWQMFRRITLPQMVNVMLYVTVMLTIGAFAVMLHVLLMTSGGPMEQTQTMLLYTYETGFNNFEFGYGFALAVMMAAVVFMMSVFQFRFFRNRTEG